MKSKLLPVLSRSVSLVAACALLGATVHGQAPATPAPGAPPGTAPAEKPKPLSAGDDAYVKNAAKGLANLIEIAKVLPASTATPPPTQMRLKDSTVKDLTAAQKALSKVTEAHGLKLPTELAAADKAAVDRLTRGFAKPPVKGFENKPLLDWVGEIVKESKRLDRETDTISKSGQDVDLKTFASNYGASIRVVFTTAEGLEKALKTPKKK